MPEMERWKDRVEFSLDGRQIFFLFFGTAVAACLIFVGGVFVGKRIEQRGASPLAADDPLAALDQLDNEEPDDGLTFHESLLRDERRRKGDGAGKVDVKPRADARSAAQDDASRRPSAPPSAAGAAALSAARPLEGDGSRRSDAAKKPESPSVDAARKPEAKHVEPAKREGAAPAKPSPHVSAPGDAPRFTLQLSSFSDPSDADGFVRKVRALGYKAAVIRSDVPGKGVFYRVRVGDFSSRAAADQARADYEHKQHGIAIVAPL